MHRFALLAAVAVGILPAITRSNAAEPEFGKQPNIILIITDDQGYYDCLLYTSDAADE